MKRFSGQLSNAVKCSFIVIVPLVLSACIFAPVKGTESPPPSEASLVDIQSSPLLDWVAAQPNGRYAETVINDPHFGENVTVQMESAYHSASGMNCRRFRVRVVVNGPPAELVVACQDGGGNWFIAPRIVNGVKADSHR